jgi:hypothetical protein
MTMVRRIKDLFTPEAFAVAVLGCNDWQEIQAQGFSGKIRTVYRFIQTLRITIAA